MAKNIRLRTLHIIMLIAAAVVGALLLINSYRTVRSYYALQEAHEAYVANQQIANQLAEGSDYLTEQVRFFVITGEKVYVDNFFEEVEVTRRRDTAVEVLENQIAGTKSSTLLKEALGISNNLIYREYDAMRLTILAYGHDPADFPEVLRDIEPAFYDMTPEEQKVKAIDLVVGKAYSDEKRQINSRIDDCVSDLIENTLQVEKACDRELHNRLMRQVFLVIAMIVLLVLMFWGTMGLVIIPLEKSVVHIRHEEPIPEIGSMEMRFLVHTYNRVLQKNRTSQEQLTYEASHDPLTEAYNRGAYEKVLEKNINRRSCLLLIDVDYFKSVNDTYGHETGDLVLKRVSRTLKANFREEDYVCRIGGDEFAVVMLHVGSELRDLIREKIAVVAAELAQPSGIIPAVTLSVGAAFSERVAQDSSLYKDADKALYVVKERGRNGMTFFGEE